MLPKSKTAKKKKTYKCFFKSQNYIVFLRFLKIKTRFGIMNNPLFYILVDEYVIFSQIKISPFI